MEKQGVVTSRDAADEAGISYRQLDYWTRIGVLGDENRGGGSGSKRRWTRRQVSILAVMGRLMEAGSRPSELHEVVAFLTELPAGEWETTTLFVDPAARTVSREPEGPAGQYVQLRGYSPGD